VDEATHIITVSGLPGSGTTTACVRLAGRLGWQHVNAGQIFRQLAAAAGVSLAEYGSRAEADGRIDRELDARMVATARRLGEAILEGRLTGWMVHRHALPALKVWLRAPVEVRAARVGRRDRQPLAEAVAAMQERERSEAARYRAFHAIDIGDLSLYDLIVDTRIHSAARAVEAILTRLQEVRA
jgi:cytidylate kinase